MAPDAINAGLYLAKGDYTNMALSSMAILPFVGDAATGAKYVGKYADDVAELGIKGYNKSKGLTNAAGDVVDLSNVRIMNKKYAGQTYNLSGDLAKKYPDGVKFDADGFPDFSPYSKATVKVDGLTGKNHTDFTLTNKKAGFTKTPDNHTWHHVEDGTTMMLLPRDIHRAVKHTGGASLLKKGLVP